MSQTPEQLSKWLERDAWEESARQYALNSDYYRRLVVEIGELFGQEAKTADDGSDMEDILCAKVPDLVRKMEARMRALEAACAEMRKALEFIGGLPDNACLQRPFMRIVKQALSSDAGKGWISPEEAEKLGAELEQAKAENERLREEVEKLRKPENQSRW